MTDFFTNDKVNLEVLKQRAYNMRWAEQPEGIIPLTAADADFPPAPEVGQALIDYINGGYFCYTPKLGFDSFKQSIARALKERKNEEIDPELVLPIDSAARAMNICARAFLKPGDEAIVFDPVDFLFKTGVKAAGGVPVLYPAKIVNDSIDLSDIEDYVTDKTRMICFCNPHNPLGALYTRENLQHLLEVANKHHLYIMNDEIWSDIVYHDAQFISLLNLDKSLNSRTISIFGFSKSFAVAGLRAGCLYVTNKEAFDALVEKSEVLTTVGGVASLSQIAGQACLDKCYYWVDAFLDHLQANRDYVCERINAIPNVSVRKPQATFVAFIDIHKTGLTSDEFVEFMVKEEKLALVPGSDVFFGPSSAGYIRLCYSTSKEILKEALDRFEEGMNKLNAR